MCGCGENQIGIHSGQIDKNGHEYITGLCVSDKCVPSIYSCGIVVNSMFFLVLKGVDDPKYT